MGTAYSASDAQTFVENYGNLPIKGNSGFTLQNYLNTHSPAWGVVVNPAIGVNVLVWFDAGNRLHVIEDIDDTLATNIAKPAYTTADESFLYNLSQNAANALPTVGDLKTISTLVLVALGIMVVSSVMNATRGLR